MHHRGEQYLWQKKSLIWHHLPLKPCVFTLDWMLDWVHDPVDASYCCSVKINLKILPYMHCTNFNDQSTPKSWDWARFAASASALTAFSLTTCVELIKCKIYSNFTELIYFKRTNLRGLYAKFYFHGNKKIEICF